MKTIFLPDPVRSALMRGISVASDGELIGGTLVLVDRNSLDENAERNFCLNHFLADLSLFGGVDMARRSVIDGTSKRCIFAYIIFTAYSRVNISGISHVLIISFSLMIMYFYFY